MKKVFISIDWDYFLNFSAEERDNLFPRSDLELLSSVQKKEAWDKIYDDLIKEGSDSLLKFVNRDLIRPYYQLVRVLKDIKEYCSKFDAPEVFEFSSINEDHGLMYYLVTSMTEPDEEFIVYNLDFHHDMFSYSSRGLVNCSNWVNHLFLIRPNMKYVWIKREDSQIKNLGYDDVLEIPNVFNVSIKDFLNNLAFYVSEEDTTLYAFLCRSDTWSPPNFDPKFAELAEVIKDNSYSYFVDPVVSSPRKWCGDSNQ